MLNGKSRIKFVNRPISIKSLRSYKTVWLVVLLVALLQTFYAAGFIARTSFIAEGKRYFCLFDDAMISMRYADNWANGHGFVWNPGERVEGYTNFAWTATMAGCHLLRLSPKHTCLLVQILGIPILWCCLVSTVLLARSCRLLPASACCAVVLVGTFYNLIFFTLFGMETGLLTALVTFALAEAVKSIRKRRGSITPMLWFAPAALVRLDVLPVMLLVFVFLIVSVKKGRRRLIVGLLAVAFVISIHFLWRYHFYGEWLPNTYYLKATGWPLAARLGPGIKHTIWTAVTLGFPALLAAMVFFKPKRWHFLIFGCFALASAYQIYIGGDVWPLNRFVLPVSLGLLVLAADGIHRAMAMFVKRKTSVSATIVRTTMTLLCLIAINAIHWDHFLLFARPQTTAGNRMNIRYVLAVQKIADPNASVAISWAGVFPYFSQRLCFDLLGKCDHHIARLPAKPERRLAGHNKYDLTYSLTTYKPDIILHEADTTNLAFYQHYRPIIVEVDGTKIALCVRRDSKKVVKEGRTVTWQTFGECLSKTLSECNKDF